MLKVYVSRKLSKDLLAQEDLIPSTLEFDNTKVAVDVEESDIPKAQNFNLRSRPLIGGSSIGPANLSWVGTLGICVTLDDNQTYILSNNHVLANINLNLLHIGINIVQPSIPDGGSYSSDGVATLSHFVPIDFGKFKVTVGGVSYYLLKWNVVDCALAHVTGDFNGANREIHWIGYPSTSTARPTLSSYVCKMGRTTGFTIGKIVDISYDGPVDYSSNPESAALPSTSAWFVDQIKIQWGNRPFSRDGDSGSLVLTVSDLRPVGLLFAGNESKKFTLCNPIGAVMSALHIPRI